MAFNFSPRVIQEGLVLYLDAANTRSYTSGSLVWNDLSANGNNGTLTNGPTFSSANGGSIVFDGVDDYVAVSNITWTPNTFTISWFTRGLTAVDFNQVIQSGPVPGWGGFVFHTTTGGGIYCGTDIPTRFTPTNLPAGTYSLNVYQHFSFTYSVSGIGSFYKNGNLLASKSMTSSNTWSGFYIGFSNSSNTINGNISNIQIYNRALSASEVLQNYNALKSRFNLT